MNKHPFENHQMTCQEWEKKILETDPDNLTDEELDMFNEHVASCPHCTAIIYDQEMDASLRQALATEEPPEVNLDFLYTDTDKEQAEMTPQTIPQSASDSSAGDPARQAVHTQAVRTKSAHRVKVRPTLVLFLGSSGCEVASHFKQMVHYEMDTRLFQYCVLDTVAYHEQPGISPSMRLRVGEEYLNIGDYDSHEVLKNLENWPTIKQWWGNRGTGVVDEVGGQMRAMGRIGLFLNFEKVKSLLQRKIHDLMDGQIRATELERGFEATDGPPTVYIVCSLAGGTGSSLFLDTAYILRKLLESFEPEIIGMALLPGPYLDLMASNLQRERVQANAYATLMELEALHIKALNGRSERRRKPLWPVEYADGFTVSETRTPFDNVFLIDNINMRGERHTLKHVQAQISQALFWLANDAFGTAFWKRTRSLPANMTAADMPADIARECEIPLYSTLGMSIVALDWRPERITLEIESLLLEHVLSQKPTTINLPLLYTTVEMLTSELESGVNPFEWGNRLRLGRKVIKTQSDIDTMLGAFAEEYSSTLEDLPSSQTWQYRKREYLKKVMEEICTFIGFTLSTYGPVATYHALKDVRRHIKTLAVSLKKLQREQDQASTNWERDLEMFRKKETNTALLYDFLPFLSPPKESAEILRRRAYSAVDLLYRRYDACFHSRTYKDIEQEILFPLDKFVAERIGALEGIEDALRKRLEDNRNRGVKEVLEEAGSITLLVRPHRSEEEQLQAAQAVQIVRIEESVQRMLWTAFGMLPTIEMARSAESFKRVSIYERFNQALDAQVEEILKKLRSQESLARRLRERDVVVEKQIFLQGASCLWNFTGEARRRAAYIDAIHLLGYGVAASQSPGAIEENLKALVKNQPIHPELVRTDREDELVLMSTLHGLTLSSLRTLENLRFAYEEEMRKAHAPYLHIDDIPRSHQTVPLALGPRLTVRQFLDDWYDLVDRSSGSNTEMWLEVRMALKRSECAIMEHAKEIRVDDANHPFFILLDDLRNALRDSFSPSASQTRPIEMMEQVRKALGKMADMEEMLFAQGWHKIEPGSYARFDPSYHRRHLQEQELQLPPNKEARIINVVHPGYQRTTQDDLVQIRPAQVIVSIQSRDPDSPVYEETRP